MVAPFSFKTTATANAHARFSHSGQSVLTSDPQGETKSFDKGPESGACLPLPTTMASPKLPKSLCDLHLQYVLFPSQQPCMVVEDGEILFLFLFFFPSFCGCNSQRRVFSLKDAVGNYFMQIWASLCLARLELDLRGLKGGLHGLGREALPLGSQLLMPPSGHLGDDSGHSARRGRDLRVMGRESSWSVSCLGDEDHWGPSQKQLPEIAGPLETGGQ